MFGKILIANRGEIACRVIRTARRLGVRTVAVYSDADRNARHVRLADEAQRIGPAAAEESYLNIAAILGAARQSGAEAIHPGYGFLAENAEFAKACEAGAITFIGPTAEAIAAMGDKAAAKRLLEKSGVPLVPGYHGEAQQPVLLEREAARIGYPVLIKPAAGGGGKGMRIVKDKAAFGAALEAAKREARSAFGDERVLIERYLERPRHIELQVFGDQRGNVVHLFERDCSVQRRHQKILEEAPAPGMTAQRREEMGQAAIAAARAIAYRGAGTVEFIVDPDGRFYFMEMNTRLQVEHPVTEMISGLDLVEWQLRVACGEALPLRQDEIRFSGHAIEARIYAEDPQHDFLPATGELAHLAFPAESTDVRVDTGVEPGSVITPWYDPLIAKLIVRGADRKEALARLQSALAEVEIAGVTTNAAFLRRVAASRAFADANLDTGLIERNAAELFAAHGPAPDAVLAVAAFAELAEEQSGARAHARASGDPYSPWHRVDGWRLNADSHHDFIFVEGERQYRVRLEFLEQGLRLVIGAKRYALRGEVLAGGAMLLRLDGTSYKARAVRAGASWHVFCEGDDRRLVLQEQLVGLDAAAVSGSLNAPMPGRIIQVMAKAGERVKKGEALLILEAMKMEHTITAPADGVVKAVHFSPGEQVLEGAELITLE